MSTDEDRILIHRLAAGELDALEEERARALIAREPELAHLLAELEGLQARVRAAFPEPPPAREKRAFLAMLERMTPAALGRAEAPATRPVRYGQAAAPSDDSIRGSARLYDDATPSAPRARRRPSLAHFRAARNREVEAGAHLFHLREVPREGGLPVELEVYAGDALALKSEVLLASAFAGSYHPTPGSLFGAIAERFGLSFESGPPRGATRHPGGLVHFRGVSCQAFDSLWVLELKTPGERFSRTDLRSALDAIGHALPEMLTDASSLTLPLLGTGNQGIDPREVAREILSAIPRWASSPRLRTVRVVTHNLAHVAILNRALDERDFTGANSSLTLACAELHERLEHGEWREPVRGALKDLLAIASVREPSLRSIALEGRRVAEVVMRGMAREEVEQAELFAAEAADQAGRSVLAAPYLQLLLAHGRAAAGEAVGSNDAVMVVYAAMRAASGATS